jgi:hypothetical protein
MRKDTILSQVFSARIHAVDALFKLGRGEAVSAESLKQMSAELDDASLRYGRASTATTYAAFAGLLRIVSTLIEWRQSILDASEGSERLLRSVIERNSPTNTLLLS